MAFSATQITQVTVSTIFTAVSLIGLKQVTIPTLEQGLRSYVAPYMVLLSLHGLAKSMMVQSKVTAKPTLP